MSLSHANLQRIQSLVREHAGMDIDNGKRYLVETRLHPLLLESRAASLDALIDMLQTSRKRELEQRIVELLVTNETTFFRDSHYFEELHSSLIPGLVAARKRHGLDIWSAACSSGQEPYSLAMLVDEHFPGLVRQGRVQIVASDISQEILDRAKSGLFTDVEINRGLNDSQRKRYFTRKGHRWQLHKRLRDLVTFRQINLVNAWPTLPQFDLILIRNVLIYMPEDTAASILGRLVSRLRPGGCVLLGSTENTRLPVDGLTAGGTGRIRFLQRPPLKTLESIAADRNAGK